MNYVFCKPFHEKLIINLLLPESFIIYKYNKYEFKHQVRQWFFLRINDFNVKLHGRNYAFKKYFDCLYPLTLNKIASII